VTDGQATSALATVTITNDFVTRTRTYTLSSDFTNGTLVDVVATNNQVQTFIDFTHYSYVWIPIFSKGTVVRLDPETGRVVGEYRTTPGTNTSYPSRVAIDSKGN